MTQKTYSNLSNQPQKFYSVGETAKILGVSITTLRRYEKDGKITCRRTTGGQRRFSQEDIAFLISGASTKLLPPPQPKLPPIQLFNFKHVFVLLLGIASLFAILTLIFYLVPPRVIEKIEKITERQIIPEGVKGEKIEPPSPILLSSLETTAVNQIINSSFEAGNLNSKPRFWDYTGSATVGNVIVSNESVRTGTMGVKISESNASKVNPLSLGVTQSGTTTRNGADYTLSIYVRIKNLGGKPTLRLGFIGTASTSDPNYGSSSWTSYSADRYQDFLLADLPEDSWQRFTYTEENLALGKYPYVEIVGYVGGKIYLDDIELTEGTLPRIFARENIRLADNSITADAGANIYPTTGNLGSLGTKDNRFGGLYLEKATISSDGNLTIDGDLTVSGGDITGANGAALDLGEATSGDITFTGDLIVAFGSFLGLSSTSGRFTFTDAATDVIDVESANLDINNNTLVGGTASIDFTNFDVTGSTGNITTAGDLAVNGGDITTTQTTFNLINTTATTLNIGGASTTLSIGASTGTTTINNALSVSGTSTLTYAPTQAHTGTWTIGSSTWNQADATIYINPASATADSNLIGAAVAGSVVFSLDAEGDIFARNLVLTGSTTTGTTTIAGDLSVEGNTTLGDATTDTLTINPATLTWQGGNKTIDITGGDLTISTSGDDVVSADRWTIGSTTAGVGQLTVTGAQIGKTLVIFNETGDQNILTASASGVTKANLDRSGNLAIEGQLSDLSDTTLTVNDALSVLGALTVTGVISDSDSNLVLDDTVDIGSGTTGIRVSTTGDISDIDGDISISDNTNITGNLDVSGRGAFGSNAYIVSDVALWTYQTSTITSGSEDAIQSWLFANPSAASSALHKGIDIRTGVQGGNAQNFTGALYGIFSLAEHGGTAQVDQLYGSQFEATNLSSGTVVQMFGTRLHLYSQGASGTINTAYSLYIDDPTVSAGSIGTNYGIYLESQTAGSTDIGLYIADADTYSLQLASTDGDAASGITFGTDTNLYRSAANWLKTDDSLDVVGDASSSGSLVLRGTSPVTIDVLNGARLDFQTSVGGDVGLTPRMTILNSGNVGIGTTGPGYKLEVAGDLTVSGAASTNKTLRIQNYSSGNYHRLAGESGQFIIDAEAPSFIFESDAAFYFRKEGVSPDYVTIDTSGNVGIGTTGPDRKLTISSGLAQSASGENALNLDMNVGAWTVGSGARIDFTHLLTTKMAAVRGYIFGESDTGLAFETGWGGASAVNMVIKGNGNVGIGTTGPDEKLELAWGTGVNTRIGVYNYLGTEYSGAALVLGNNIRVRTDSVTGAVVGNTHATYGYRAIRMMDEVGITFHTADGSVTAGDALGNERMRIDESGNVGIGRSPTTNKLEVEGNASKTTAGDWLANSDIRIKTDIQDLDDALNIINQLRPVKFKYTDEYMAAHPSIKDQYYYNFIAQEFQEVFPDAVKEDGEGYLQLDAYVVRPYLVAAVQELDTRIKALEADVFLTDTGDLQIAKSEILSTKSETNSNVSNLENSNLDIVSNLGFRISNLKTGEVIRRIGAFAEAAIANLRTGSLETQTLSLNGKSLENYLSSYLASVSATPKEATNSALFSSQIDTLSQRVEFLEKIVLEEATNSAKPTNIANDLKLEEDIVIEKNLNVLGKTTLSDLGITGNLTAGLLVVNGLEGTIDTLGGPLKLQELALGNLEIMGGKVIVDTKGNLKVEGEITAKKYNVDTSSPKTASLGKAVLPVGQTKTLIETSAVASDSAIFVTPETLIDLPLTVTSREPSASFTVEIAKPQEKEIKFSWWVVN